MTIRGDRRARVPVALRILLGLAVIGAAIPLTIPLGSLAIVVAAAGAGLLADALRQVVPTGTAVLGALGLAAAIFFAGVALIFD